MKWLNRLFGGPKDMAALPAGTKAPDFTLPDVSSGKDGGSFSLQAALQNGPSLPRSSRFPVLLPVHVPVSGTHPPSARDTRITIVGISQDNQRDTAAFLKEYGVTFRTQLDDPNGYAVSNAYGLTNVPSLFLIGQDGRIEVSSVGWVKQEVEDIHRKLASWQQTPLLPLLILGRKFATSAPVEDRKTNPAVAGKRARAQLSANDRPPRAETWVTLAPPPTC